ncbi:MAG TPA: sn-glycerol-3-phosphate ABC transporter ATP-binding protein UgpC [Candidatus Didemnitutus sp.]|nr:sn-glycerol-3-phosphate ABC transporter ATP-binding protein UgpC [Candidatus Didemnitutus sp.]
MAKVLLENLVKTYPEKRGSGVTAVKGVSLTIEEGEFMVLVGPSGCGKSTTLRMIAGLEEITAGTISIDGRVVNDVPPKDRDIAMVFQNYALYPHMTVYENMAFGLKLRKMPRTEIDARVREAAAMLGLEELLARQPKALSGGQRQRVALGRAIVRKPKVFLFDEPLSNLDAKMRVQMRSEIARLHARLGATLVYVTHDQVEAMTMGDRICVMKDGEIQQVAAPLELYDRPRNLFTAGFIGSPAMNFISGRIETKTGESRLVEKTATSPIEFALPAPLAARAGSATEVVLGLRPEDLVIGTTGAFSARVELSEPMGAETYLHLRTAGHALVARIAPGIHHSIGAIVSVSFDPAKAHLFDAATQQVIG